MKYELVIFDLDGTILNTLDDLTDSLNYALTVNKCPERSIEEVRSFVGNGIYKLIERGVPSTASAEMIEKVYQDFSSYYKVHCADKTKAYDGIIELIHKLREEGIKTAVVSNKADYAVQVLCKQYFEGLFDTAVGEKPDVRKKPAPDSVNEVLNKLQICREKAVYIGDSEVDIETAKNAEMDCISVDWGFRDKAYLKEMGAMHIVSNVKELLEVLSCSI